VGAGTGVGAGVGVEVGVEVGDERKQKILDYSTCRE